MRGSNAAPSPSPARLYSGPGPGPGVAGSNGNREVGGQLVGRAPPQHNLLQSSSAGTLARGRQPNYGTKLGGSVGSSLRGSQSATELKPRLLTAADSIGSLRSSLGRDTSVSSLMTAGSDSGPGASIPPKSAAVQNQVAAGAPKQPFERGDIWVIEHVVDFTDYIGEENCLEEEEEPSVELPQRLWRAVCSMAPQPLLFGCERALCNTEQRFENA
mmetsp:Transcript_43252/g.92538  ORF Transcript_43252/g.92538 Transcript_43252/m.92538 type:complete len:215 (-) Transcript_43252:122-766(-)|eukprot:CAMPEP_0206477880 /NCGR_PEP_ID=MMETSP0324_2-20121206/35701_1 /ASSEMBLY_ACC=CAM_ASM_000836 /TAXON_ID=2866 /ORGANISM="Crypthecodinium cohnii, Strain Seligo" /LENGTH=214 /DNA_ID=CAMNT_0053954039 /DNA_START=113 /DNA_END=757 /DNA_ORIENTATION=+